MNIKLSLALGVVLATTTFMPAQSHAAQNRMETYNGLAIEDTELYNNRGRASLPDRDQPTVMRPIAPLEPQVSTTNTTSEQAREQRQMQLDQERQARLERLQQMQEQSRITREEYLQGGTYGQNASGSARTGDLNLDQNKMALLNAYRARRSEEIQNAQQRYERNYDSDAHIAPVRSIYQAQ